MLSPAEVLYLPSQVTSRTSLSAIPFLVVMSFSSSWSRAIYKSGPGRTI